MIIEVAIGPGSEAGKFRVEVMSSPAGEASALVKLNAESFLEQRERVQAAVLASAEPSERLLPRADRPLRVVGEALFAALLGTGAVAERYRAAAALAAAQGSGLRVVLRIGTPELAQLPWEAMYDREGAVYVCRRDQLVRHVPVASVPPPPPVQPPLRILGVVSSPRGLPSLAVEREQAHLVDALAWPASQGLAELHWAPSARWADLHELLLEGGWHVLHFIGHGDFHPRLDEGVLALTDEDGRHDLVTSRRLVDLLRQARPMPRLVVLNSCSGATTGSSDFFSGTAAALVRGGVSAVAAMQYAISDEAAAAFTRGFYAAIARGRGIDDAALSGRVAILGLSEQTLEWVTPVLYLRGHDSRLFTVAERADSDRRDRTVNQIQAGPAGQAGGVPLPTVPAQAGRLAAAPWPFRLAQVLAGHTAYATAVRFSPDGTLVATAGGEGAVRLWDPRTGASLRLLDDHGAGVSGVAFSPDGSVLASVGGDRTLRLWDPHSGTPLRATYAGHPAYVTGVAFSPDGTVLATAGWDPDVRVRDAKSTVLLRTLDGHGETVAGIAFSPDGSMLAGAVDDGTVRLWDVATGGPICSIATREQAWRVAFSPAGVLLATGGAHGTVELWDVKADVPVHVLCGHVGKVLGLSFHPDGRLLATVGEDRTARLWDVGVGAFLSMVTAHDRAATDVAFSPGGTMLATVSEDGTARLWAG